MVTLSILRGIWDQGYLQQWLDGAVEYSREYHVYVQIPSSEIQGKKFGAALSGFKCIPHDLKGCPHSYMCLLFLFSFLSFLFSALVCYCSWSYIAATFFKMVVTSMNMKIDLNSETMTSILESHHY